MSYLFIGASFSAHTFPCQREEDWDSLLAAMERNDAAAIIAITTSVEPKSVPFASLRNVAPPTPTTLADLADSYWSRPRAASPKVTKLSTRVAVPDGPQIIREVRP